MIYFALGFALGSLFTFALSAGRLYTDIADKQDQLQSIMDNCYGEGYQKGYQDGYWNGRVQGGDEEPTIESLAITAN